MNFHDTRHSLYIKSVLQWMDCTVQSPHYKWCHTQPMCLLLYD